MKLASPAKITNNYHQYLLWPPSTTNISQRCWRIQKIVIYWLWNAKTSVEFVFPLICSHLIFLDETAVFMSFENRRLNIYESACWAVTLWEKHDTAQQLVPIIQPLRACCCIFPQKYAIELSSHPRICILWGDNWIMPLVGLLLLLLLLESVSRQSESLGDDPTVNLFVFTPILVFKRYVSWTTFKEG